MKQTREKIAYHSSALIVLFSCGEFSLELRCGYNGFVSSMALGNHTECRRFEFSATVDHEYVTAVPRKELPTKSSIFTPSRFRQGPILEFMIKTQPTPRHVFPFLYFQSTNVDFTAAYSNTLICYLIQLTCEVTSAHSHSLHFRVRVKK